MIYSDHLINKYPATTEELELSETVIGKKEKSDEKLISTET